MIYHSKFNFLNLLTDKTLKYNYNYSIKIKEILYNKKIILKNVSRILILIITM